MIVTVKLFATLRQTAGWSEQPVDLADGATVEALMAHLMQTNPGLDLRGRAVYAAVNQSYVRVDHMLADGDMVALFPPVSGGMEGRGSPPSLPKVPGTSP